MNFKINKKETGVVEGAFDISVFIKGIDGVLEIISGVVLIIIPLNKIQQFLIWLTRGELAQDKKDIVANLLVKLGNSLSIKAYDFTIVYLLIHGFVKVILVFLLLKKVLWSYPVAMIIFSLFGIYQVYQYNLNHSFFLLLLTVLDIIVICLTGLEYRILLKKK